MNLYPYISCIFIAIICAILSVIIYEKNWLILTGGIAHTAFGGIGVGIYAGFNPMIGAAGFSLASALLIANKFKEKTEVTISILWASGMAIGTIFYNLAENPSAQITDYLFGDIMNISNGSMIFLIILSIIVLALFYMYRDLLILYLSDREYCSVRGINVKILDNIILIIVAMAVVAMLKLVGIILIIALLAAPIAIAVKLSNDFTHRIFISGLISLISSLLGVLIADKFLVNSGASIALVSCFIYLLSSFIPKKSNKHIHIKN